MWDKSSHSFARWVLASLALGLAACSGGGGDDGAAPKAARPTTSAPVTTVAPPAIDLDHPIPGGSLDGTPRPPLENTGDDYVAIFRSLDATYRWLTENPDPSVISEIFAIGTEEHGDRRADFERLATNGWRAGGGTYQLLSVEVINALPGVASLRVVELVASPTFVDARGNQIWSDDSPAGRWTSNVLMASDGTGHWRIADWAPLELPSVEL